MKALSLWQPYASLWAVGLKRFETRHWSTNYRGPLAVHAAKNRTMKEYCEDLIYGSDGERLDPWGGLLIAGVACPDECFGVFGMASMPAGCVIAIGNLIAVWPTSDPKFRDHMKALIDIGACDPREEEFGDFGPDRFAWELSTPKILMPPVMVAGRQGLFSLPQGWLCDGREAA
ncbi:MAG: ASCH domain-containing protein [Azospirillum sp.]|nr:ASCH domain-containing protein [Azospirillum sp.]